MNVLNATELFTSKLLILRYANFTSIIFFKKKEKWRGRGKREKKGRREGGEYAEFPSEAAGLEGFRANSLSWSSSLLLRKETRAETIDTATREVPARGPGTGMGARAQRRMLPSVCWALRCDVQGVSFNHPHNSWNLPRPPPPTLVRTQNTTHCFFPPPLPPLLRTTLLQPLCT